VFLTFSKLKGDISIPRALGSFLPMQFLGISDNITNLSRGRGLVPHPSVWISCRSSAAVHLPFFSPGPGELSWKGKDHNSIPTTNINFPTVSGTKEPYETASLIFFGISPFSIVMIWKHSTRNNKNTLHSCMATDSRHLKTVDPWENFTRPMKSSLSTCTPNLLPSLKLT